jgi:hypothetical protein
MLSKEKKVLNQKFRNKPIQAFSPKAIKICPLTHGKLLMMVEKA